jgi:hypothetical protein
MRGRLVKTGRGFFVDEGAGHEVPPLISGMEMPYQRTLCAGTDNSILVGLCGDDRFRGC